MGGIILSCQIYLTELNFAASILAHIEGCCRKQLSKLYSCIIYCCDGAQDVIFWIQKHFHYEDPREKFFSGQQNENLKQLTCLYLVDNVGLFTEHILCLAWPAENAQPSLWPISSVSLKPFATLLRGRWMYPWIIFWPILSLCPNIFHDLYSM